jgi:hypothetical protein
MKKIFRAVFWIAGFVCVALPLAAQSARDESRLSQAAEGKTELPLKRISLFSSGNGYFEHSGRTAEALRITLPFDEPALNDALKSLVIHDPASASPSVRYASANTLEAALRSLKIDLSGNRGIGEILNSLKGADLEVSAPSLISGRIMGVENRFIGEDLFGEEKSAQYLSLFTLQGIKSIALKDISSFSFKDEKLISDLNRALDLIMNSRARENRDLLINLPGTGERVISLSYVIPSPVWKVSYRLDLSGDRPFLQGWAIIDNDSDTDWNNVELSLITGKPVSFIQNLYPPYRTVRPTLPLSVPGVAEGRVYESGTRWAGAGFTPEGPVEAEEKTAAYEDRSNLLMKESVKEAGEMVAAGRARAPAPAAMTGGVVQTAAASAAGDQFEFTLRNPVTLERRQSAMLPLVEGSVKAERALVFSGSRMPVGVSVNPAISTELTNTSGMKLPAGPITVYDGGIYSGDALIEFFPENEKRIISYGEDLSVRGSAGNSSSRLVTAVTVSGGVMTINRRQNYEKTYTLKNASGEKKRIIIEHPLTQNTTLAEPGNYDERTPALYRFIRNLDAKEEMQFKVREEMPVSERIVLAQIRGEAFLAYATNQEIPANVRAALSRAVELRRLAEADTTARQELENQKNRLVSDQDRVRRNLEAAGNQSAQGQEYLKRLAATDAEIDALNVRIEEADQKSASSKKAVDDYIANLTIQQP